MHRSFHRLAAGLIASATLLLGPAPNAMAADGHPAAGHVYVLNNTIGGTNSITVFNRSGDGALQQAGVTDIGGQGSVKAFADGTQGSLIRTPDGERLFAVDAGSDEISVVDVDDGRLAPVGVFPSGGAGPVSLTYQDGLLYVLNAANTSAAAANVAGFRVDEHGRLHPIPGATRPLSAPHPNPAEVLLDPQRNFLLVTEKATGLIDIYRVRDDGSLSGSTSVTSVGTTPFGMAFDPADKHALVVADAGAPPAFSGAATSYRLRDDRLLLISGPIPDHQIAPCWMVVTRDGHFAYTSNADSRTISGYRVHTDGTISLLDATGATGTTPADTFPLEEALSRNSRFLYVLDSRLLLTPPGPVTLSGFRIQSDGHLTSVVDPAAISLPLSAIGLAAE